jgi:HD-GYP domain-containing protein (c-di-GMP phosphodiesterase class II)/DNA-binding CsgD family transcriptional regulator
LAVLSVERVRLGELLAGLSIATDLGLGFPPETAVRNTLIAMAIAEELGLDDRARSDLFFASLLSGIGCTGFAHEMAQFFGDEFAAVRVFSKIDSTRPREAMAAVAAAVRGAGPGRRTRVLVNNVSRGKQFGQYVVAADCEGKAGFVRRLGLGDGVAAILTQMLERWDGKGGPRGRAGDVIDIGARIVALALQVEIFHRTEGRDGAVAMSRQRSGGWFDPACVDAFIRCADGVLGVVESGSAWSAGLASEPEPHVAVPPWRIDDVAAVFADFADLKSPYLLGHSRGVARLAVDAAERLGLGEADRVAVRRAALLHDLGRVAVSAAVWDKPGMVSPPEWEQVRLHAYYTERVLNSSSLLQPFAALAGAHHERLDGRGYHRGVTTLPPPARVLAAADVLHALTEPRPHRPPLDLEAAGAVVEAMARTRTLDPDAASAVCTVASAPMTPPAPVRPAGLTEREMEVARLLARGRSNKQIARELVIAQGTVGTHVAHVYQKAGVSTRAGIAMFAMEHGLV